MSDIMDELIKKEKIELAKRAIKDGMELKDVAKYFKLPLSVVEELAQEDGSKEDNKK